MSENLRDRYAEALLREVERGGCDWVGAVLAVRDDLLAEMVAEIERWQEKAADLQDRAEIVARAGEQGGEDESRCRCDGAAHLTQAENAARHPFLIHPACPMHGEQGGERAAAVIDLEHIGALAVEAVRAELGDEAAAAAVTQFRADLMALGVTATELGAAGIKGAV